jgi:hypothetical protein
MTDYGNCCQINAFLNFVNPTTRTTEPAEYAAKDILSVPAGSTNGVQVSNSSAQQKCFLEYL